MVSIYRLYLEPLVTKGTRLFVRNIDVEMKVLGVDNILIPVSFGTDKKHTSYVASLLSQQVDYTREEILQSDKYSKTVKTLARWFFPLFRTMAQSLGVEKTVYVNNWLLSTNLYDTLSTEQISSMLNFLRTKYPEYAVMFRSVNETTDPELFRTLQALNAIPLVSRQVYLLHQDKKKYKKKRPFVTDKKYWEKRKDLRWFEGNGSLTTSINNKIIEYYNNIYLEKYSVLNPQYTEKFIEIAANSKVLSFQLMENQEKELLAVQAIYYTGGKITTPFIGYDTSLPREEGIYRLMNMQLMQEAINKNLFLNMSSGAGKFKKQRGGEPSFEHHFVYVNHLSNFRQLIWKVLNFFSERYAKPAMIHYQV